jgi:hypothetical protein
LMNKVMSLSRMKKNVMIAMMNMMSDDGLIWNIVCCDRYISRAFFYILHNLILGSVPFFF